MMETIGKSSFYRLMKSVSTKMGQIEDKTGHEQGILDKIKQNRTNHSMYEDCHAISKGPSI